MRLMRFKTFLKEGGNIKIGEHQAAPIDLTHPDTPRKTVRKDVHDTLHAMHKHFHEEHGEHLFGPNAKALHDKKVYSGSTDHLFNDKISDEEHKKYKPKVGDIDVKVPKEHKAKIKSTFTVGKTFGKHKIVGVKHGAEHHMVVKHTETGKVTQIDMEPTEYHKGEPHPFEHFSHSSNWEDTKHGIKGGVHKRALSCISPKHKFGLTTGLRPRVEKGQPEGEATRTVRGVTDKLFGKKAKEEDTHSFVGLTRSIKKHIPKERHQDIAHHIVSGLKKSKMDGVEHVEKHLTKHLGYKPELSEEAEDEEHHASFTHIGSGLLHQGHVEDLVKPMTGEAHVGLSKKHSLPGYKEHAQKTLGDKATAAIHSTPGAAAGAAWDKIKDKPGRKHLHLHFGHDRKALGEGLKKAIEGGNIKEIDGVPDKVTLHLPKGSRKYSGTSMRNAANSGDIKEFHRHLGPNYSKVQAKGQMAKMKSRIDSGVIKMKR